MAEGRRMTQNFTLEWCGRDGRTGRRVVHGEAQLKAAAEGMKRDGLRMKMIDKDSVGPGRGEFVAWEM
jgi:hypothetical protein